MKGICLLVFLMICFIIIGCGEDVVPEPAPSVLSVSVQNGGKVPGNEAIMVTFSKEMDSESLAISLNDIQVLATSHDGIEFSFMPLEEGETELKITGRDISGQSLDPPYSAIKFTVAEVIPPEILGAECRPKDGELDVEPGEYAKYLLVVFSEPMSEVDVINTKPEFNFTTELSEDGRSLKINFVKFTMSNETQCSIKLSGRDLVGNALKDTDYSFVTVSLGGEHITLLDDVIIIEPFAEGTIEFELIRNFLFPEFLLVVSGPELVEGQIFINGRDIIAESEFHWIEEMPDPEDKEWHQEYIEFSNMQKDILVEGKNVLKIKAKAEGLKIRKIDIHDGVL